MVRINTDNFTYAMQKGSLMFRGYYKNLPINNTNEILTKSTMDFRGFQNKNAGCNFCTTA